MYRLSALAFASTFALTASSLAGEAGSPGALAPSVDGQVSASAPRPSQTIEDTVLAASPQAFATAPNAPLSSDGPYVPWPAPDLP